MLQPSGALASAKLDASHPPPAQSGTVLPQSRPDEGYISNFVTQSIDRYRAWLFATLIILYIISFNGRWRIGTDSAIYRGVASNLSHGKGFQFGEWATQQVYPGLPLLLAGINRVFGSPADATHVQGGAFGFVAPRIDTLAAVAVIALMGLTCVLITYKLTRLHYPRWMATCVAFGVGINSWVLQLSNEILTDIPFLLGVLCSLYGWELLKRAKLRSDRIRALLLICPGLILAGSMRPTFWVLALTWGAVCLWGLIRGPRRRFYSTCLVLLIVCWTAVLLLDPRHRGVNPLVGGYEREALELLPDVQATFPQRLHSALRDAFPAAFFGEQMAPFSILSSVLVLGSCLLLFRKHALWALMVFVTFVMTLALSTQPRYYVAVIPMLLLGWLLMLIELAKRMSPKWGTFTLLAGLALVTCNNISGSIGFIREQRSSNFVQKYRGGRYMPILRMSDLIIKRVPRGTNVLGPAASIMSYVTGIHVFSQRELIPRGNVTDYPQALVDAQIRYAVFPARAYRVKEPMTARLLDRGLLVGLKRYEDIGGMWLARVQIYVPPGDWRDLPRGYHPPTEKRRMPATAPSTSPSAR